MTSPLRFTPLTEEDLELLHSWFVRDHVRPWWPECQTPEQVRAEFVPALEGRDPCDVSLIVLDDRPIGLIQTYRYSSYAESAHLGLEQDVAGVDLLIGEQELIGHGLGPRVLETFLAQRVFADPTTIACAAEVDVRNTRSLRAFAKAGFSRLRDVVDPEDGETYALMRRDRADAAA